MEQNANPPITQQNQSPATPPPPPHKDSFVFRDRAAAVHSFFKRVSLEITIGAILLLVLLGIANYFNVIPLSQNYPQIMGWLPYQRESTVSNIPNQQNVGSLVDSFSASPSPTFFLQSNTLLQNTKPTLAPNPADFIRKNATSSIFTTVYEGVLISLDTNGSSSGGLTYKVKFQLKGKKDNIYNLFFNEGQFKNIKISQTINNQEVPINLDDIRVDNNLIFTLTFDIIKDPSNNLIEGKLLVTK